MCGQLGACSPASEGSTRDCEERGGCTPSCASPTPGGDPCCESDSRESRSTTTYVQLPLSLSPAKSQPLRKLSSDQVEESMLLYLSGLSLEKVAVKMGVTRQAMHDLLKRRIVLRDRVAALPRKPSNAKRRKRAQSIRRYRERAARITAAQIRAVMERDLVCQACGELGRDVDHIIPVSMGGQTEMENLQLLCQPCHFLKSGNELRKVVV